MSVGRLKKIEWNPSRLFDSFSKRRPFKFEAIHIKSASISIKTLHFHKLAASKFKKVFVLKMNQKIEKDSIQLPFNLIQIKCHGDFQKKLTRPCVSRLSKQAETTGKENATTVDEQRQRRGVDDVPLLVRLLVQKQGCRRALALFQLLALE